MPIPQSGPGTTSGSGPGRSAAACRLSAGHWKGRCTSRRTPACTWRSRRSPTSMLMLALFEGQRFRSLAADGSAPLRSLHRRLWSSLPAAARFRPLRGRCAGSHILHLSSQVNSWKRIPRSVRASEMPNQRRLVEPPLTITDGEAVGASRAPSQTGPRRGPTS